jgi:hypothetical protein
VWKWGWVWEPQAEGFGFSGRGCHTCERCFLGLPSSRLTGCWGFRLRRLRPGRLIGGGHFTVRGGFRDRLGRVIWSRKWSVSLYNTPPSDVTPPLAQVHLLGRWPCPLFLRSSSWGGALAAMIGLLLGKRSPRLLPLSAVPVVRCVVPPQRQHRGRSRVVEQPPESLEPHTRRTRVRNRSYAACGRSVGSACIAVGPSVPRTIPPTLAGRRVR